MSIHQTRRRDASIGRVRAGERRTSALWFSAAVAVSLLLHARFLTLPMISDEGGYAYVTQRWLDGRGRLYHDIWVSRPQGIFVAYAAIFRSLGTDVAALRLGAWIVSILTMAAVWIFAQEWGGPRVAKGAVLLFAVVSGSPAIEGFTANAEVFMALPAALAVLLLLRASRRGWGAPTLFAAGALSASAMLLKPSGIVMLPIGLLFVWLASGRDLRGSVGRCVWQGAGFAAMTAPALVHGYLLGWREFSFAAVTYRFQHQNSATRSPWHHVGQIGQLLSAAWPLLLLASVPSLFVWWRSGQIAVVKGWAGQLADGSRLGIVAWAPVRRGFRPGTETDLLLRLWLVGCAVGIAMGGDWWSHYLVQIVAPFTIWLAAALLDALRRLPPWSGRAMLVAGLLLLLIPYRFALASSDATTSREIFHHSGYSDQSAVATYLRENTPPETPIFAAFNEAALYYLADRPSTYRYLYDQELQAFPGSEAALIAMVNSPKRPVYVIGTKQRAPFNDYGQSFWAAVAARYHLETTVHGVPIFHADVETPRQSPAQP